MNYYNEIKEKLIKYEVYEKIKEYAKEQNKVKAYYENGKLLSEAGKEYGKNIIGQYAQRLVSEVGKKYNERTLYRMRKLYEIFSNEKLTPLVSKLNWSQCLILITIKDSNAIMYYINETLKNNLSKRQLEETIKSHKYERLPKITKEKLVIKDSEITSTDLVLNPIIIKNDNENISEYALK